jgi:hypothetical protein
MFHPRVARYACPANDLPFSRGRPGRIRTYHGREERQALVGQLNWLEGARTPGRVGSRSSVGPAVGTWQARAARLRRIGRIGTWPAHRTGFVLAPGANEQGPQERHLPQQSQFHSTAHRVSNDHAFSGGAQAAFRCNATPPRGQDGSRVIVDGCSVAPRQPQVAAEGVVTVAATSAGWNPGAVTSSK